MGWCCSARRRGEAPADEGAPPTPAPAPAAEPCADYLLGFDEVHEAVVREIAAHPGVWVRENKDLTAVCARFDALHGRVPMMRVIHGSIVEALGRVPRSDELHEDGRFYWRPLNEVHAGWQPRPLENDSSRRYKRINVSFLSHRWTKPTEGLPDDDEGTKAKLVASMSRYHCNTYEVDSWWWIDWTCAEQSHTAAHIAALPLYIAASTDVVSVYTPGGDYDARGWIRVERALSAALNSPRSWKMVPPQLFVELAAKGQAPSATEWWPLHDPAEGQATVEGDRAYLVALSRLALELWPVGFDNNWESPAGGNRYAEWGYKRELVYGQTAIFLSLIHI